MAQPDPYNRQTSFTAFQESNPSSPLPGDDVDAELNAVKLTTDQIRQNLSLIQRDDGELQNAIVTSDKLNVSPIRSWAAGTLYKVGNFIVYNSSLYLCAAAHQASSDIVADIANGMWTFIVNVAEQGAPGEPGGPGIPGADGNTILYGSGAPGSGLGVDGNFYIDTTAHDIYGPKAGGAWPAGTSLIGPPGADGSDGAPGADGSDGAPGADGADGAPGADGADGAPGADGADGNTVLYGSGAPGSGLGVDGNFYIDTTAHDIYGPKAGGAWPAGTSLIGPPGAGSGDVLGPATNTDGYIPQWNGPNSKTLKDGIDPSSLLTTAAAAAAYQPLDADLTAVAGVTTASYGRSLLAVSSAANLANEVDPYFLTPAEGNAAYQPLDADLTAIAALATATYGRSLLTLGNSAALTAQVVAASGGGTTNFLRADGSWAQPPLGIPGARNLQGGRDATVYKWRLVASEITLRDSAGNGLWLKSGTNGSYITCDTSVAGPAANGRDQAGAFSTGWLHFYWIAKADGTLATIASANATAPAALPAGYTYYCYASAVWYDASGPTLSDVVQRGDVIYWANALAVANPLSGGSANTTTAVNCTSYIPPNAEDYQLICWFENTATIANTATIFPYPGLSEIVIWAGIGNSTPQFGNSSPWLPNIAQTFYYSIFSVAASTQLNAFVNCYRIPNSSD